MKIGEILALVKFAIWLIPQLLGLIEKAREVWPKKIGENEVLAERRRENRRAYVDPRVAVKLQGVLGRSPTEQEITSVREMAYTVEKKARRGKAHGRA